MPEQAKPVLDYASPAADGLQRLVRRSMIGGAFGILAAASVCGTLGSIIYDYCCFGGRTYSPWRWYDNDAVALCALSAGFWGLLSLAFVVWGLRPKQIAPRPWVYPLIPMDLLAVLLYPVCMILHAR